MPSFLQADPEGSLSVQGRMQGDHGWTEGSGSSAHSRYMATQNKLCYPSQKVETVR